MASSAATFISRPWDITSNHTPAGFPSISRDGILVTIPWDSEGKHWNKKKKSSCKRESSAWLPCSAKFPFPTAPGGAAMLGMVDWTDELGRRETDGKGEQWTAVQTPGTSPDGAADHGAGIFPSTGRTQTSNTGLRILPRDKIRGTGNRRKKLKK